MDAYLNCINNIALEGSSGGTGKVKETLAAIKKKLANVYNAFIKRVQAGIDIIRKKMATLSKPKDVPAEDVKVAREFFSYYDNAIKGFSKVISTFISLGSRMSEDNVKLENLLKASEIVFDKINNGKVDASPNIKAAIAADKTLLQLFMQTVVNLKGLYKQAETVIDKVMDMIDEDAEMNEDKRRSYANLYKVSAMVTKCMNFLIPKLASAVPIVSDDQ